jgi:hypothetical protein
MASDLDNETWIVEAGGAIIEKKANSGVAALFPVERLIYCLWVADYGMQNAGDLDTAQDLYEPFQREAANFAKQLGLPFTAESFSLPTAALADQYFERLDRICDEIKAAHQRTNRTARAITFRKLRIAWSVAWGILAVLLCVLWVRSYWWVETAYWDITTTRRISISSMPGALWFDTSIHGPFPTLPGWPIKKDCEDTDRWLKVSHIFPVPSRMWGEFLLRRSDTLAVMIMPLWFAIIGVIGIAAAPWLPFKRFSLCTLLIATTLVAVVLGLIVWLSR